MNDSLQKIREALKSIPVGGHDERVQVAFALKSELGEDGRSLWDDWRGDRGNDEADAVWRSASANGPLRIGTLFHTARRNGWTDSRSNKETSFRAECFSKNLISERINGEPHAHDEERCRTAKKAQEILSRAKPARSDHPYLIKKSVSAVDTLSEIDLSDLVSILGYAPKSSDEPLQGRILVVPVNQGGAISTVELIDGSKRKAALPGRGTKVGGYWSTEKLPNEDSSDLAILLGEGVATVLSAVAAAGGIGVSSLSAGNLVSVATMLRSLYPNSELIVLADLDKATGKPDHRAVEAAKKSRARLAIPDFGESRASDMTDFNDLAIIAGAETVRLAIRGSLEPLDLPVTQTNSKTAGSWEIPLPLIADLPVEPYPIDALPSTIRGAVEEVAGFVKAPLPLVASSALASVALAAQGRIDVQREQRLEGPSSLFFLTIADSGERKSSCDGYFSRPIREYEAGARQEAKELIAEYHSAIGAWDAKHSGLREKIRQLAKEAKPTDLVESDLRDLEREKPRVPRYPRLLYADATPEALAYELATKWPSGGLVSSEAGLVLGSHGMGKDSVMRNLALLNQLWDGGVVTIDRRSSDSFSLERARLTVSLQIQEPTLRAFFEKSGDLARGTGFLARFLIAWPESTQGKRRFCPPPVSWPMLENFYRRLESILNEPTTLNDSGGLQNKLLTLDPSAKAAWVAFHDAIEEQLANGGDLRDIRDVASKSADNAARLAALFHFFEYGGTSISFDSMERATRVVAWHLSESRRFFGELSLPRELFDALKLDNWLIERSATSKTPEISTRNAQRLGPVREKGRLDQALNELESLFRVRVIEDGRRRNILVNPHLIKSLK